MDEDWEGRWEELPGCAEGQLLVLRGGREGVGEEEVPSEVGAAWGEEVELEGAGETVEEAMESR